MPQFQFLKAKITAPELPACLVERRKLIPQAREGLEGRVTLISAPAGYGKTIFATQWLRETSSPSAWLSLGSRDSDLERFLYYTIGAINALMPGFGQDILRLISAPTLPPKEYLADALVVDLDRLEEPLLLAYDDYHKIRDRDVHDLVVRLVQHLPRRLHLLFMSRTDPPWPLARWRSYGWMSEIRAADLRFSLDETAQFFGDVAFSPESVKLLHERSEGWIAGLQLMKLSLHRPGNTDMQIRSANADSHLVIQDYLLEEVLSHQSDEVRDFLAVSSLLDCFCAPLCDCLLPAEPGNAKSEKLIAEIKEKNLFVVSMDPEHIWYRYHHLFQKMLRQHLRARINRERMVQLHRSAGEWFAGNGLIEEALRHFLAAGDVDAAVLLIEKEKHQILDAQSDIRTFNRWVSMFPASSENNRPSLMVLKAIYYVYIYNLAGALTMAQKAEMLLRAPDCSLSEASKQQLIGEIETMFAFCFYWQGDPRKALQHAEKAITLVPLNHYTAHGAAIIYAAFSQALIGRRKDALKLLENKLAQDYADKSRMAGQLLTCQAIIRLYAGEIGGASNSARRMLEINRTVAITDYRIGSAYYFLGSAAYERNDLDEAESYFRQAEKLRYLMDPRIYHDALLGLARIATLTGEDAEAAELVLMALDFAQEMKDPYRIAYSKAFEMRRVAPGGIDLHPSEPYAFDMEYNEYWIEPLPLIVAECLVSRGTPEAVAAALAAIEEVMGRAREYCNTRQVIQLLALKAVALKAGRQPEDARRALEESLGMAEPHGFVRTFVDRGPIMAELLSERLQRSGRDRYTQRLLEAFEKQGQAQKAGGGRAGQHSHRAGQPAAALPDELLSNRELDVLEMLGKRLTNKEIAEQLCISANTVKCHTVNIYQKLGVNNRQQAVRHARLKGLLPSL